MIYLAVGSYVMGFCRLRGGREGGGWGGLGSVEVK